MSAGDGFLQGMDVSKWQPTTPDLTGVHYLIARRGIGTKLDATYDMHIGAAKRAGIATGSYWYGIGSLPVSDEVDAYIAAEGDVDLHTLDWEGADGFTEAQARQFIALYQNRTGRRILLYASEGRFKDLGQDGNWIANYSQEPTKQYDIWQYGPFHGADGNRIRGTMADLTRLIGATVPNLPITDSTEKIVTTKDASIWYNLDGTAESGGHAALGPRRSPYGVGSKRAIFVGSANANRVVLIVPATVVDGAADLTPFAQSDIDAAVAAATASENAAVVAANQAGVAAGTSAEKSRIRSLLGL